MRPIVVSLLAAAQGCVATRNLLPTPRPQRVALASFYGPRHLAGADAKLATNTRGETVLEAAYAEVLSRLTEAVGPGLLTPDRVVDSPGYAALAHEDFPHHYVAAAGARPLPTTPRNDAALGALARSIGVDLVLVIRADWTLRSDLGSPGPYGHVAMTMVAVGADGRRLLELQVFRDAAHAGISREVHRPEVEVPVTGNAAVDGVREAVARCMEDFAEAWTGS